MADASNHRVQIFERSTRGYVNTMGATGAASSADGQFNSPTGVAVDSSGNIYVADLNNHRVQVFNSSRAYVRTIGVSGVSGSDFDHLRDPLAVVVDAVGRTYVSDNWGNRV